MNKDPSARRCLLFVPGDSQRKIEKSAELGADCVIFDLEDSVAPARKEAAREMIASVVPALSFSKSERLVRVNGPETEWFTADLGFADSLDIEGVVISKVETAEQLQRAARITDKPLFALIETALAVMNLREIARATTQLVALMFGGEDFSADLGAILTEPKFELFYARSAVVTAAAAYGLQAIDMVNTDFRHHEGLAEEALVARRMGYSGKMAIHPNQVAVIQQIFSPDETEIKQAEMIVKAYLAHIEAGEGVFAIDGRMVDGPVVRRAQKLLDRARSAGLMDGENDSGN